MQRIIFDKFSYIVRLKETIAILAITKNGIKIAKKIQNNLTDIKLYVPSKFKNLDENSKNIFWYDDSTSKIILDLFKKKRCFNLYFFIRGCYSINIIFNKR